MEMGASKYAVDLDVKTPSRTENYVTGSLTVGFLLVTAALVTLTIVGSVYVNNLHSNCVKDRVPKYQVEHQSDDRDVLHDRDMQTELSKNKDSNGRMVSLVTIDYHKRMVSLYVAKDEKCYLIGGIVPELRSFDDDVPVTVSVASDDEALPEVDASNELLYVVHDKNPVTEFKDFTINLTPYCKNTNTYWVERRDMPTSASRKKRFLDTYHIHIHIGVCNGICFGK